MTAHYTITQRRIYMAPYKVIITKYKALNVVFDL